MVKMEKMMTHPGIIPIPKLLGSVSPTADVSPKQ